MTEEDSGAPSRRKSWTAAAAVIFLGACFFAANYSYHLTYDPKPPRYGYAPQSGPTVSASETEAVSKQYLEVKKKPETPDAFVSRLTPLGLGLGLVVCEPIPAGSNAQTAALGDGCSRWLHLDLAADADFSATPRLNDIDALRKELGWSDLRIGPDRAIELHNRLGVSNAATATIEGDAAHCKLTYQLQDLGSDVTVGAPIVAEGSYNQVVAMLPQVAARLATTLGLSTGSTTAPPDRQTLAFLGSIPWEGSHQLSSDQFARLEDAAGDEAVAAAFLALYGATMPGASDRCQEIAERLSALPPHNFAAVATIAAAKLSGLKPSLTPESRAWIKNYPANYQVATIAAAADAAAKKFSEEEKDAETAARCAGRNPFAWIALGKALTDRAEKIREARPFYQMSSDDQEEVAGYYPVWVAAARLATRADSRSGAAWLELAKAAAFNGDGTTADSAYTTCLACPTVPDDAYFWGIELYQDKWFPDKTKEGAMFQRGLTAPLPAFGHALYSFLLIYCNDPYEKRTHTPQETTDFNTINRRALDWFNAGYDNQETVTQLADFYYTQKNYQEAAKVYQRAVAGSPNDSDLRDRYAFSLERINNLPAARDQYIAACRAKPADLYARYAAARLGGNPPGGIPKMLPGVAYKVDEATGALIPLGTPIPMATRVPGGPATSNGQAAPLANHSSTK